MAVGPFRAMLTAHFGASRNRVVRELGRRGALRVLVIVLLLGGTVVVPLLFTMFGGGMWLGSLLPSPGAEGVLSAVVTSMTLFGGATSGAVGGAKQLTWESYRTLPVRLRSLFLAELVAGLFDLVPLVIGACLFSLLCGVAVVQPRTLLLLPLLLIEGVLAVLLVQLLVGSLADRIVRRLRVALSVIALAFFLGLTLTAMVPAQMKAAGHDPLDPARIEAFLRSDTMLRHAVAFLPATFAVRALSAAADGHWLRALSLHAYPILSLAVLSVVVARLLAREAETMNDDDAGAARLWSFRTPVEGVARLQFASIISSRIGRFGLVVPLIVMALVKGPLAEVQGQRFWSVPGAFLYVSLVGSQFQLNQFGLDGHGVKTLFLLPIDERVLFRGKSFGIFAYQGAQALLLTTLIAVLHRPSLLELAAGLVLFASLIMVSNAVGRRTSVSMPRMLPRRSVRANATPLAMVLIGAGLSIGGGAVLGGTYAACMRYAPVMLLPVMLSLLGLSALLHRAMAPRSNLLLRAGREKILGALAGAE